MDIWIAFFRGVNVGGATSLPMKDLVALFKRLGFADTRTYIQSGNVIFRSPSIQRSDLAKRISDAMLENHDFQPVVILLSIKELNEAVTSNPFPEAETDPKSLHLYFLAECPGNPNFESLHQVKSKNERFALKGKIFYLHAPDGIGRSKLATKAERFIGVDSTARNWRTASRVLEMAKFF